MQYLQPMHLRYTAQRSIVRWKVALPATVTQGGCSHCMQAWDDLRSDMGYFPSSRQSSCASRFPSSTFAPRRSVGTCSPPCRRQRTPGIQHIYPDRHHAPFCHLCCPSMLCNFDPCVEEADCPLRHQINPITSFGLHPIPFCTSRRSVALPQGKQTIPDELLGELDVCSDFSEGDSIQTSSDPEIQASGRLAVDLCRTHPPTPAWQDISWAQGSSDFRFQSEQRLVRKRIRGYCPLPQPFQLRIMREDAIPSFALLPFLVWRARSYRRTNSNFWKGVEDPGIFLY